MKLLFFVIVALVGAVGLALLTQSESGYVLINYGPWSVETSFTFAVLLLLLGFVLFYAALRLIAGALALPARLRAWRNDRRARRARLVTHRGLIALAEGHWLAAERDLVRHAERSEAPLLNYLGAARAAQMLGDEERRDYHLAMAHETAPEDDLAVGMTQAELQLAGGRLEQALATLMHLYGKMPKNIRVLQLLQQTYERLGSWNELVALLPELRKRRVLEEEEADLLERRSWETLLRQAHEHGHLDKLRELWERIPRHQRQHAMLLAAYVRGLLALGGNDEAENLLREALRRQWDAELVRLYGLAEGKNPTQQLAVAEEWLKRHQRHPLLLLSLGRLAMRAQLWGKARAYLEASAGLETRAETYRLLGELLERLGEESTARDYYHKGLALVTGNGGPVVPLKRFPLMTRNMKKT